MAEPFLSEIRIMSFSFAPKGWALCNGQFLPINQNQALFALLGTTFGGDGRVNFALPDLRGRTPVHRDQGGYVQGMRLGEEVHTVTQAEMPQHAHVAFASANQANQAAPGILAAGGNEYRPASDLTTLHPASIANVGGSQPHENRPPFTVVSWCIALVGVFPSQS